MKQAQNIPIIRFKGFTMPWEKQKIKNILKERNVQHPQNDKFPLVSFTVENGVTPKTERYEREQLVKGNKSLKKYKETRLDDIVYNPANLKFGAIARNKYGNAVFSPIYITYEVQKSVAEPSFVEMSVTRNSFIQKALQYQQGTVYERMAVNTEDFASLDVLLPAKDEQNKVGKYFSLLDSLITQYGRKLSHEKKLKEYLLQNMFPQDGESVPRLRFPGFSGEWEKKTLGKIADRITRKNSNHETNRPLTISAEHGLVDQTDFFSKQVASENLEKYYLLYKNEFAYNRSAAKGYKYGVIRYLKAYEEGAVSTLYICFKLKKGSQKFLEAYFDSHKLDHQLKGATAEGSRNHGLLNITTDDFFKIPLLMPTLPEQEKIADFFTALDEKIDTMEQQLEDLKEMKKGFLQQMFI